ncbi:uncharacterized protein EV422DRAFT_301645 [Fimicolochytrium jonesii]|uniref:uncharacterized protein n=1 Tax=Fimicolochytrium jonesii TaxID=1396493 RepID=UPI0022FF0769|nr:uncharacterized protein EV422DRAFT_301645 [Fimicolochytrium jonesii]KAI8823972.1 hypothetical protein EV422DRAFT_301645 [Fimicolochytrium jonesii]
MRVRLRYLATLWIWSGLAELTGTRASYARDVRAVSRTDVTPINASNVHRQRRSFEAINTADPLANSSSYYAELSQPGYGLWIWTNIGRLTRLRQRNGPHMPLPIIGHSSGNSSSSVKTVTFDQDALKTYFLPVAIFVGFLLLIFLMTCCSGCFVWWTRKTRLQRTQKEPYTFAQKARTGTSLGIISLFWVAAIAWGFSATQYLDRSVYIFSDSTDYSFRNVKNTVTNFSATVNDTFLAVENGTSAQLRTAAHYFTASESVAPIQSQIATLVSSSQAMGNLTTALLNISTTFMNQKAALANTANGDVTKLQTALIDNNDAATLLTSFVNFDSGGVNYQYKWNVSPVPTVPDETTLDTPRDAAMNSDSLTDQLVNYLATVPDMAAIAVSAAGAAGDLPSTLRGVQEVGIVDIQNNFTSTVDALLRMDIVGALAALNASIDDVQPTVDTMAAVYPKYKLYRWFILGILFSLPAVILATVHIGIGRKKPAVVRCCLCGAVPYTLLALFSTVVLLCASILLGEACTIISDRSTNGTATMTSLLTSLNPTASTTYTKALLARDSCIARTAFLEILDGVIPPTTLNYSIQTLPAKLAGILDGQEFGGVAGGMSVGAVIGDPGDLSIAPSIATTLSSIIANYPSTDLIDLRSAVDALKTTVQKIIDSLHGTSAETDADNYPKIQASDVNTTAVLPDALQDAINRLQRRITAVRNEYISIRDTELQAVLRRITAVEDLRTSMTPALNAISDSATRIPSDFQTVNSSLTNYLDANKPKITDRIAASRADIKAMALSTTNTNLNTNYRCDAPAINTVDMELAICDGALPSLDALHLSLLILSLTGTLLLPTLLRAAHRLADPTANNPLEDSRERTRARVLKKRMERRVRKGDVEAGQVKWDMPRVDKLEMVKVSRDGPPNTGHLRQLHRTRTPMSNSRP